MKSQCAVWMLVLTMWSVLMLPSFGAHAFATDLETQPVERGTPADTLQNLLLDLADWRDSLNTLAKLDASVTEDVIKNMSQTAACLQKAKETADAALQCEDPLELQFKYAQTKLAVGQARSSLTRATTVAIQTRASWALVQALLALGKELDEGLAQMKDF